MTPISADGVIMRGKNISKADDQEAL